MVVITVLYLQDLKFMKWLKFIDIYLFVMNLYKNAHGRHLEWGLCHYP
jgi:hypothetical protein